MVEQVGGDHYDAEYEHWDWVAETGLGYLEACATKYLTRWRKKDGVVGLQKAISYLQKIKEMGVTVCPPAAKRPLLSHHRRERFIHSNNMKTADANIIARIDTWESHQGLDHAIELIRSLINEQAA